MQTEDSQPPNHDDLSEREHKSGDRFHTDQVLEKKNPSVGEKFDVTSNSADATPKVSQIGSPSTVLPRSNSYDSTDVPMRRSSKYPEKHDTENIVAGTDEQGTFRSHSVGKLRKYFTSLSQSDPSKNAQHNSASRIRKFSYTIPHKSTQPLFIDSDPNTSQSVNKITSVSGLRQCCDGGKTRWSESLGQSPSSDEALDNVTVPRRATTSKSVEFFSRPPKYRTPSPKHQSNLPTPPPLPLPPSPEMIESHFRNSPNKTYNVKTQRSYSTNYVTHLKQPAQPIVSVHLPFRSRSLALDRRNGPPDSSVDRPPRYRARSITQRSLSPVYNKNPGSFHHRSAGEKGSIGHRSREVQTRQAVNDKAVQSPNRTLIPVDRNPWSEPDVIYLNQPDGVYVRSAVVYEHVADKSMPGGPKHFVTTYILSQGLYPSRATVQATNLWVAERALQSSSQSLHLPPYRTQTLSRSNSAYLPTTTGCHIEQHCRTASMRLPKGTQFSGQCPRSQSISNLPQFGLSKTVTQGQHSETQPLALPAPPPVELHPYILRCSQENSPYSSALNIRAKVDKHVQCQHNGTDPSPSPTRSWSVKSLSPPPFRTPWLSSLRQSNFQLNSFRHNQTVSERGTWGKKGGTSFIRSNYLDRPRTLTCRTNKAISQTNSTVFRMNRPSEISGKHQWIRKAENIGRGRQTYHELRGSWSPPHVKSPARYIPNDLEENTEREIRNRMKRQDRLSPMVAGNIDQSTQTHNWSPEVVDQNDSVALVDREVNVDLEEGGIDTTPITEDFDAKRVYFEELIRNNEIKARCSFCNDCFHCPGVQYTPAYSSYSSWDSNLQNTVFKQVPDIHQSYKTNTGFHSTSSQTACIPHQTESRVSYYSEEPNTHDLIGRPAANHKVHVIKQTARGGPQQYSSSLYMAAQPPCPTKWDALGQSQKNQYCFNANWEGGSIQHEYYAKPHTAMPKVAPNPPGVDLVNQYEAQWHSRNQTYDTARSYAELVHSPMGLTYTADTTENWKTYSYPRRSGVHSPTCRFYNSSKNNSVESLHDISQPLNTNTAGYQGRVKQMVSELNERTYSIRDLTE